MRKPVPAREPSPLDVVTAWTTTTVEAMDTLLDRVSFPGDYAPDLQAALDRSAVDMLRQCMREGDRALELLSDVRNAFSEAEDEAQERVDIVKQEAADRRDNDEGLLRYICQEPEQHARVREELEALDIDPRNLDARTLKIVTAVARGICTAFLEETSR
jgi:ribosomal protein L16 Arg81 hydroxylase